MKLKQLEAEPIENDGDGDIENYPCKELQFETYGFRRGSITNGSFRA
ncbi:Uncharacterised protein [Staphylococcus gallinarum]|uniref:Uncharacterized protein n=1 Tax=Staphylococcus gallinarum TaxID=1293 RepID=A0A380FF02_STAGA|nr:Uncharacterised protein [Staphylococcus gallinarum]